MLEDYILVNQILLGFYYQNSDYNSNNILVNRIVHTINLLANLSVKLLGIRTDLLNSTEEGLEEQDMDEKENSVSLLSKKKEVDDNSSINLVEEELIKIKKDLVKVSEAFLSFTEDFGHTEIINKILEEIDDGSKCIKYLLNEEEMQYAEFLDEKDIIEIIKWKPVNIWTDELENFYITSSSIKILQEEVEEIGGKLEINGLSREIKKLVESTYFDESHAAKQEIRIRLINSEACRLIEEESDIQSKLTDKLEKLEVVAIFKDHLFTSKELINDKSKWINLVESIKDKKIKSFIDLKQAAEILMYSRLFDDVNLLIRLIEESESPKQIILGVLGNILGKIPNKNESIENINQILEKINIFTGKNGEEYIRLLVSKLAEEITAGLKYESSEMSLLKDVINNSLSIGAHSNSKILKRLEDIKILKWSKILREEKIKYDLGRDDEELIKDILCIEKNKGIKLTTRLIDIVKDVEIGDLELKYIIKKFKKNVWELSSELLDEIEGEDVNDWIDIIKRYDEEVRGKELSVEELVSYMKRLEEEGEINHYIKKLLDRSEEESLIEQSLKKLSTNPEIEDSLYNRKARVVKLTKIEKNEKEEEVEVELEKSISEYTPDDIKAWAEEYRKLKKEDKSNEGIVGNGILELMAVISRASILVNKYDLRDAQKIALLIFIDSMVNRFEGRLANISTGEGKSLITITTAIAQILISGGGTVDILTSSEVLAERDAEESKEMFGIFDIKVSNNCDAEANSDEKIRKERYENNDVIYGEIGHFQRDILLTKYYDKEIRGQLGTSLIIDEVDSMCIDNMCNTLYISHQIADLRYLKDILIYIWQAVNMRGTDVYTTRNVEEIKRYIEELIQDGQINFPKTLENFVERRIKIWINNAYLAKLHMEEGNQYSVLGRGKKVGEAVINDLQTGVEQLNTQWSEGLQQFIQLKHTNKLTEESLKAIFMSNYIYFKEYGGNIYGMTGTLGASIERDLLAKSYGLDFYQLPRFKKELNIREEGLLVSGRAEWIENIKQEVKSLTGENRILNESEVKEAESIKEVIEENISRLSKETNDHEENKKILEEKRQI